MKRVRMCLLGACIALAVALLAPAWATETENQGIHLLPAPGKVVIDGKTNDWDLSGGVFACGDVEHLRDQFAVWIHVMYDADHVYVLARWKDPTPLNNPENKGGHGFNGDCLQVRFITFPGGPDETVSWWDFWRDARGLPVIERGWPGRANGVTTNPLPVLSPEDEASVTQAFSVDPDGKGYAQEVAIPWKLLSANGAAPKAGDKIRMTVEPNFTAGTFGRITIKDIFNDQSKTPDRVFTFRAYRDWGWGTLDATGGLTPAPVRLADGRTFPMTMQGGVPSVDWTGIIHKFEWPGFKPLTFDMPFDGYVSLNIIAHDGTIARHLLNADPRAKGHYTVTWDGLTDAVYRTPGQPVPAGEYTWKAIAHPGAKLTFRGYACDGGRVPWDSTPQDFWLGDHGEPSAVVTDATHVYLACDGAEGGRHLLATDLQGHVQWGLQNTTGGADPEYIALDDGALYVLHQKVDWMAGPGMISRVEAKSGAYLKWPGANSHILALNTIWPAGQTGPDHFDGLDVHNGKLYATISDPEFFSEDIADWKALVTQLKGTTPLAKRIMERVSPDTTRRLSEFLAGKVTQEQAFLTWLGGPRFDREVTTALTGLLNETDLAPNTAKLSAPERRLANRRFLETALTPAITPLPVNAVVVLDVATGKVTHSWPLPYGSALKAVSDTCIYVISAGESVLALDPTNGKTKTVVRGLHNARGITVDDAGKLYVSVNDPQMQVLAFTARGKAAGHFGRTGGRAPLGKWQADGMYNPAGLAVDHTGQLWVMEHDAHPKRVSVWNVKTGGLVKDFFGPTQYGASGSAIDPRDPNLMIGVGCEWRLDPKTGTSACVGTFDRRYHNFATYREGKNGKLYLITIYDRYGIGGVQFWEVRGEADLALRAELRVKGDPDLRKSIGKTELWTDLNGDGKEQPNEVQTRDGALFCAGSNGWSLNLGPDMTLYPQDILDKMLKALPMEGFTDGGAPRFDLAHLRTLPEAMSNGYLRNDGCAVPSADNKTILVNLRVKDHPAGYVWHCFDLATGALKWTYPNAYFQVGGSHSAPAADPGLFRGAYGPIGSVKIPGAGNTWIINGNLGEWGALTEDGYYLSRLFNGSIFEWHWPADAAPGGDMTNLPPGCGGEDFGGSVTQAADGKVYIQAGKMAVWNIALSGLDQTVAVPGGTLTLSEAETRQAFALREAALQAAAAGAHTDIKRATVTLTGNIYADFKGVTPLDYQKSEDARIRTMLAHDDTNLYLGWEVRDATPWVNGATDISQMYACGDTVDLQLGTDTRDPKRNSAAKGDLRLSIGNFGGKPTAVLYKFVTDAKKPRTFTSGVIQGYQVDWVDVLAEAKVTVKVEKERYFVEAAVPLAALGLTGTPHFAFHGDVGVTHGDASGTRTKLRTYWANQQTGLVDDVVFELRPTPANWGELTLE